MIDVFNKLIRRALASTIRCPKKPRTKGDILKYALRWYLNTGSSGLCYAIKIAAGRYHYKYELIAYDCRKIPRVFPLFEKKTAIRLFGGRDENYWWPIEDWKSRYRYMKWLIRQYNNVKL